MRRKVAFILYLSAIAALVMCGAAKLDEKLDSEYSEVRLKVNSLLVSVDTMISKIHFLHSEHDEQDVKINRYIRSAEDVELQDKHNLWFADFESALDTLAEEISKIELRLLFHDKDEATHDTASAKVIRADHKQMLDEIENMQIFTQEILDRLLEADSVIHTFFADHTEFHQKYDIPREFTTLPPTFK